MNRETAAQIGDLQRFLLEISSTHPWTTKMNDLMFISYSMIELWEVFNSHNVIDQISLKEIDDRYEY